jgi:hypothetical protein
LAVISILLLISGITGLELSEGQILEEKPGLILTQEPESIASQYNWMVPNIEPRYFGFALLAFLTLFLLPKFRIFIRDSIVIIFIALGMVYLINFVFRFIFRYLHFNSSAKRPKQQPAMPGQVTESTQATQEILPEEFIYNADHWLNQAASILIITLTVVVLWWLFKQLIAAKSAKAKSGLHNLKAGLDNLLARNQLDPSAENMISECYRLMCDTVREHGIDKRPQQMTAREYLVFLEAKGVSSSDLDELTTLFEKVRYGSFKNDAEMQNRAACCLQNIRGNLGS